MVEGVMTALSVGTAALAVLGAGGRRFTLASGFEALRTRLHVWHQSIRCFWPTSHSACASQQANMRRLGWSCHANLTH
jgi:hypothetical protein